jgi:hypothetical protein
MPKYAARRRPSLKRYRREEFPHGLEEFRT